MPKQGQSVETCVIVGWKKKAGDAVRLGEVLCEVETDKATFEVESPAEGTLLAVFFEAGSDVPVLTPIAAIGKPGEDVEALRRGGPAPAEAPARASESAGAAREAAGRAAEAPQAQTEPAAGVLASSSGLALNGITGSGPGGRIIERDVQAALAARQPLTPAARAVASGAVPAAGSGIGGRVTAADVGTAAAGQRTGAVPARPAAPAFPPRHAVATGGVTDIPLKGVRKIIAERMLASLQTTAQLTMHAFADARSLVDLRRKFKESPEELGLSGITINDMVLYAVSRALLSHRDLNAHFTGDTIRQFDDVHLGFAVDTPKGLMVPVVKAAHTLGLREISAEAARLIAGCREGGVKPDELSGGTFTITNLGAAGVETFTPVLNPPQVGILGVGTVALKPVQGASGVEFVPHLGLSLTINHQVVDGAPGARFLQTVAGHIARFEFLLIQ
jgi:pyruvate dehydrogenase E2 component (dihydrolipoamide acetyltransferase)